MNSNTLFKNIIVTVEYCLLPKLGTKYDETETHPEFNIRMNKLRDLFDSLIKLLEDVDLRQNLSVASSVITPLLILYEELQSDGPWNTTECKECAKKLNNCFAALYNITLDNLLKTDTHVFNNQAVFDMCIDGLHRTLSPDLFKLYPGRVEVYCSLMTNVQDYLVKINPIKALPATLLLIDDYIDTNKQKGLKCCKATLMCVTLDTFNGGNYYDVIWESLNKSLAEKNIQTTELVLECFTEVFRVLPSHVKLKKAENIFNHVLEHISMEANLYRKAKLFAFTKTIIQIGGTNCARRNKRFMAVVCDNLDICTDKPVAEILLLEVLQCLEVWIKYCWCVWHFSTDHNLLSLLFKVLFVNMKDDQTVIKLQNIIITLIRLCKKNEQENIMINLQKSSEIGPEFTDIVNIIIKEVRVKV